MKSRVGLSTNKAKTIKELSTLFLNNKFSDLTVLNSRDPSIMNSVLFFGIGPWSVNMFEIFCLGKNDIFSSKDAGLRLAMNNLNMVSRDSDWNLMINIRKNGHPIERLHVFIFGRRLINY